MAWEGCFQVLGSLFKNEIKAQKGGRRFYLKQQKRQKRVVGHMVKVEGPDGIQTAFYGVRGFWLLGCVVLFCLTGLDCMSLCPLHVSLPIMHLTNNVHTQ